MPNYIISLGVGWLALLILAKRQCESLTSGIGAEEQTPTSFLFPLTIIKECQIGECKGIIYLAWTRITRLMKL